MVMNPNNMNDHDHKDDSQAQENIYSSKFEENHIDDLEQNAPELTTPVERGVNKKALAAISAIGIGVVGMTVFAFQALKESEEKPKEQTQVVTVPDLPPPEPVRVQAQQQAASTPVSKANAASEMAVPPIPVEQTTGSHANKNMDNNMGVVSTTPVAVTANPQPVQTNPLEEMRRNSGQIVGDGDNASGDNGQNSGGGSAGAEVGQARAAVRQLTNRDKLLVQGTYLRCVLETKIITEVAGYTSCVITEPVYSASGQYVLIPKGSKAMGQYNSSNPSGPRLGVVWDRIITPTGLDITLSSPGVDGLGAAGHPGKLKTHWPSRFASALLISMISDTFKYAAAEYGPQGSTVTTNSTTTTNPYESETANTLKQMAINQLERNNSRPNTITINQGTLLNIYTAHDIDFSSVIP